MIVLCNIVHHQTYHFAIMPIYLIILFNFLNQGVYHERNKTFYLQQNNNAKIGRWSFENRLNNILSLLGDKWLDENQTAVKKMLNNIIKENIPAKCS
jgi:hypothetical protein